MRKLAFALAVGVLGTVLAPFVACSDGPTSAGPDSGTQGDGSSDGDTSPFDSFVEAQDSGPNFNADGWVRIDYPNCNFYAAPSAEKMPPPIAWEPCSSLIASLGLDCRQARNQMPPPATGASGVGVRGSWVDANGKAWLTAFLGSGNLTIRMVAEADGPVHQAISFQTGTCAITNGSLTAKKAVFMAVRPASKTLPEERGALGGDVDGLPLPLEHWADGAARAYTAGPSTYFANGPGNAVRPYAPNASPLGAVPVTDPGQIFPYGFIGDELFYQIGNLSYSRIKVYSVAAGARDLISFGNVVSANASDFGTDGIDMVWIEATGRLSQNEPWTAIDIMTSKFTTDASKIQKRRLRSESGSLGAAPFTVGCGHAAHFVSSTKDGNIVRIVRLSDGRSWRLPEVFADGSGWLFQTPRAITCDELFVSVNDNGRFNTVRIRLDSLGAGEPAD